MGGNSPSVPAMNYKTPKINFKSPDTKAPKVPKVGIKKAPKLTAAKAKSMPLGKLEKALTKK